MSSCRPPLLSFPWARMRALLAPSQITQSISSENRGEWWEGGRQKEGMGGRKDYGAQRKGKKGEWKRPLRNRSRKKMYGAEWVNSVFKKHTATKMTMKWTEELEATCIMKIGEHLVWQHEELWGWKTHTKWHTESRQRLGHQRLFTECSSSSCATCYCCPG